jgi:serine protease Do
MKLETLLALAAVVASLALVPSSAAQTQAPKAVMVAAGGATSFLGVGIKEVDSERAKALKLKEEAGVEVTHVEEMSPAEKAGLKSGDVIVEYNGQRVEGIEQFSRMVRETPAGRDVKLSVFRNGSPQTIVAKVGARSGGPLALPRVGPFEMPDLTLRMPDVPRSHLGWRSSLMGIEAEALEGQLADYFGVKEGILVRNVNKGSAAEKAGIRAGDVITRIDGAAVASPSDISSHLRSQRGKSVPVVVMRDRKEVTVSLSVPSDDRSERRLPRGGERPMWL